LKAVAGVRESVDERFALVQDAIADKSDIEQIKKTISEELSHAVQEQLKVTVRREIVNAIREKVTRTVQQQVSEVVCREVKSIMQREFKNIVDENVAAIIQQQVTSIVKEQVTAIVQQQVTTIVQEQVTAILEKQLSSVKLSSPSLSYADVARTPPGSHLNNLRTHSNQTTPSILTDTLYCIVDVSNVEEADRAAANAGNIRQEIEKGMREGEEGGGWRCVAVARDPRNSARIRITCRDESELARVKEVAEKTKVVGSRVLRDQWYPIKVDNACKTVVLDENGEVRAGMTEMLEKENDVKIAKLSWLSRKDSPKAYRSMVVYVTKRADAARLLEGQYFDVDGESAFTRVLEPSHGPTQSGWPPTNQSNLRP
jgi:hypothetical protein